MKKGDERATPKSRMRIPTLHAPLQMCRVSVCARLLRRLSPSRRFAGTFSRRCTNSFAIDRPPRRVTDNRRCRSSPLLLWIINAHRARNDLWITIGFYAHICAISLRLHRIATTLQMPWISNAEWMKEKNGFFFHSLRAWNGGNDNAFETASMTRFDISYWILCVHFFFNNLQSVLAFDFFPSALAVWCWRSCDLLLLLRHRFKQSTNRSLFFQLFASIHVFSLYTATACEALPTATRWMEHDLRLSLTRLFDLS